MVRKIVFVPSLLLLAEAMLSDKRNICQNFEFQSSSPTKPHHLGKKLESIQCCEASYFLDTEAISIFDHFLLFSYM